MTTAVSPVAPLRAALDALAEEVAGLSFALPAPDRPQRRDLQRDLVWSVREYLLPRLGDLDAPAVAVMLGSTGSGKSTLVNSLAQAGVSRPGVVRPTTRTPVVWTHADHAARYREGFLDGYGAGPEADHGIRVVAGEDPLLAGVTVVDSPDFDSVVEEHRRMADDLLAVADLCVFVTSAQRYADAVPWDFLRRAKRRQLPITFVVNRIPPADRAEVVDDYTRRLREEGLLELEGTELLAIDEQQLHGDHGGLPPGVVAPLRRRLELLGDPDHRRHLVDVATRGAAADVVVRARQVAAATAAERAQAQALVIAAERAYDAQIDEVAALLADGSLIRGEVVARWQEFVGTGQLLAAVTETAGAVRRWLRRVFGGTPVVEQVERETRSELTATVVRRADLAAAAAAGAWELDPAGAALIDGDGRRLWRHADETPDRTQRAVEEWIAEVALLVEDKGAGRKRVAQAASYGVNAAAVVVILGVFAHTGGLTGAEVGVAATAAAAQQKLLEHAFGSAAARTLVTTARDSLQSALAGVLRADGSRFTDRAHGFTASDGAEARIEQLAEAVAQAAAVYYRP